MEKEIPISKVDEDKEEIGEEPPRMSSERVIIKGNKMTKESSVQAAKADIFDSRRKVIVEVVWSKNPSITIFTKPKEFNLRYVLPLGFAGAALNFGVAGFPWGSEFLNAPTLSLPDPFFLDGNSFPLGGPTSLLCSETSSRNEDFAVTAMADLSFDLPLIDSNIRGHAFACSGTLLESTENSFRSSAGFGLIIPTKFFRMEVNFCYIHEHDGAKTGVQFSFSLPL